MEGIRIAQISKNKSIVAGLSHCTTEEQVLKEISESSVQSNKLTKNEILKALEELKKYSPQLFTETVRDQFVVLLQKLFDHTLDEEAKSIPAIPIPSFITMEVKKEDKKLEEEEIGEELEEVMHIYHKHILKRTKVKDCGYFGGAVCDAPECRKRIPENSEGITYHCSECRYDLHPACVLMLSKLPQELNHPSHEHTLERLQGHQLPPAYIGGEYSCNLCSKNGKDWDFHCSLCNFDSHIECVLQVDEFKLPYLEPRHRIVL